MVNVEQNNNNQTGIKPSLTAPADIRPGQPMEHQQIHDEIKNEMEDRMEVDDDKKQEDDDDELFEDAEDYNNDSIQWSTANINNNQQENINNINQNHHKNEQKNDNNNDGYVGFNEPQRYMAN
eukprot:47162_1